MIKENQRTLNQINGLTDVLILFPCMILAYFIRFTLFHGMPGHIGLSYYLMAVLCVSPLFWLLYGLMGLYDSFRAKNFLQEFSLLLRSNTIIFGILLAFAMLFPNVPLYLMFIPIPIKAKYFVIFYGLAELFMGVANNGGDSVAHFAHLGGMLFGYFLVRYWKKKDIDNGRYFY